MKKVIFSCFVFLIFLCLIQCKNTKHIISDENILSPLKQTILVHDLSEYVENIEFVELEETERSLLAEISKLMIDKQGNLFTLSNRGLVVFKSNGCYYKTIAGRGKGNREYISITDVAISENGDELMLLDNIIVRCYGINDSTQYREFRTPPQIPIDAIAPAKNGGAYLFTSYPANYNNYKKKRDNLLFKVDREGKIIEEYIQREDCTFSMDNVTQSYNNRYFLRPQDNKHIIYELTSDNIKPLYKIDFGKETIPNRYYFNKADEDISLYMRAPYFKLPIHIYATKDNFIFKAVGNSAKEYLYLYSIKDKQGIYWIDNNDDPLIQILSSDKDYFYSTVSRFDIEKYDKENPSKHGPFFRLIMEAFMTNNEINKSMNNPFIVKIKFNTKISKYED